MTISPSFNDAVIALLTRLEPMESTPPLPPAETVNEPRTALVACGALAQPAAAIVERRDWPVDVHPLPPLLHNQPHLIADEVRRLALKLAETHDHVAVAYADCGTYGALDELCARLSSMLALEVHLTPGESVVAEAGQLGWFDDGIERTSASSSRASNTS